MSMVCCQAHYIPFSMHHRKYNSKKKNKTSSSSLINFDDFVKYRSDKEKIINNPFEENWKKAIVFQELLQLYKPQENDFVPNSMAYDKKNFQNFYKHKGKYDEEDSAWENNEDYQLNKLYKMSEGINNYEEQFQNHKIAKLALKIDARDKGFRSVIAQPNTTATTDKLKRQRQKCTKENKIYFRKEDMKQFENFINFKEKHRRSFLNWKIQIQKLQKKAVDQYGVVFKKEENDGYQLVDYAQYKAKEDAILQKFIRLPSQHPKQPINKTQAHPISNTCDDISNIPKSIFKRLGRPNTSCPTSPAKMFSQTKKSSDFVKKKYIRVPAV